MTIPEPRPVRALLDPAHQAFAAEAAAFAAREIAPRPAPESDAAARVEARALLAAIGAAQLFDPIRRGDWRACCLAREALAAQSPLADAVFALQGLGTLPLLLTGSAAGARLAEEAIAGRAMAAFAMTETEAGSDVAALRTRARREGGDYILDGAKSYISNAGIADFYVVFATTDP
jgi:acyl-CoA dehydrogenase